MSAKAPSAVMLASLAAVIVAAAILSLGRRTPGMAGRPSPAPAVTASDAGQNQDASLRTFEEAAFGVRFAYPAEWGDAAGEARPGRVAGYFLSVSFSGRPAAGFLLYTSDYSNGTGGPAFGYFDGAGPSYAFRYPDGSAGPSFSASARLASPDAVVVGGTEGLRLDGELRGQVPPPSGYRYGFINAATSYKGSASKGAEFYIQDPTEAEAARFDRMVATFKATP